MQLVIIESKGKVDTIKKFLGKDYEVFPTFGHIRDLPAKTLAVDVAHHFEPQYVVMPDKKDIVEALKKKYSKADKVFIATDPDREGEAIAWHVAYLLGIPQDAKVRVTFNEITKSAVEEGIKNIRTLDLNLINAQQARRVLDRLVGYKLSPILCRKIQPKLSAGRVQSATLKLVVDREREIQAFVPQEYWTLSCKLSKQGSDETFGAMLTKYKGKKITVSNKEEMDEVLSAIKSSPVVVDSIKNTIGHTHPTPPYITSSMQQDATTKLGMSIPRVSAAAQTLYEGVDLGQGKVALITYIRTDSVRIAPEAIASARKYISSTYGQDYLPPKPNVFKTKKSAQDAHEAIRPVHIEITPDKVRDKLSPDLYRLYKMIFDKFIASQMADSTYSSVLVDMSCGDYTLHASGRTPIFDGFQKIYNDGKKKKVAEASDDESANVKIPALTEGETLEKKFLTPAQKFTKAPSRYTDGTLVDAMESLGIGRPATTGPTVELIAKRKYTEKQGKELVPTPLGISVIEMLEKYFLNIVDAKFTASMEDRLDDIADKGEDWHEVIEHFYGDFEKLLQVADKDSTKLKIAPKPTDKICDKCGSPMVIRSGKYGEFIACSNYPICKNILSLDKVVAKCPKCGGNVVEKHGKKGNTFYGCSNYPKCDFISWDMPTDKRCPKCKTYLTKKKVAGKWRYKCASKTCDYTYTESKDESNN